MTSRIGTGSSSTKGPTTSRDQHYQEGEEEQQHTRMYDGDPRLSELEVEVLEEYRLLRHNLEALAGKLGAMATVPSTQISEGLRLLERKTAPVCTSLKASVYGIVLQQQIESENQDEM